MRKMKKLLISVLIMFVAFGLVAGVSYAPIENTAIWGTPVQSTRGCMNMTDYIQVCPGCILFIDWGKITPIYYPVSIVGEIYLFEPGSDCQYIVVDQVAPCASWNDSRDR
jgi:hypothetical protein